MYVILPWKKKPSLFSSSHSRRHQQKESVSIETLTYGAVPTWLYQKKYLAAHTSQGTVTGRAKSGLKPPNLEYVIRNREREE